MNLNQTYHANRSPSPFGRYDMNHKETELTVKMSNINNINNNTDEQPIDVYEE